MVWDYLMVFGSSCDFPLVGRGGGGGGGGGGKCYIM